MKNVSIGVLIALVVVLLPRCWLNPGAGTIDAPVVTGTTPTFDTSPTWDWTVPEGAVDFRYRLDLGAWQLLGSAAITSYTPSSPLSRGAHLLEVQAAGSDGSWSESGWHTIYIALEAPEGVSASDDIASKVTISWNSVTDASMYYVCRSLSTDTGYGEIGETAGLSFDDSTAPRGNAHYYRVRAKSINDIFSDYSAYDEGRTVAPSGPGTCSLLPSSIAVNLNDSFTTDIHVDTGTQRLGAYGIDVLFDSSKITVDTDVGASGVSPGADGFVTAVSTAIAGVLTISGFDVSGKGPSSSLHLVTINWTAAGTGTTNVAVDVITLVDVSYNVIGTPAGVGNTVTVN